MHRTGRGLGAPLGLGNGRRGRGRRRSRRCAVLTAVALALVSLAVVPHPPAAAPATAPPPAAATVDCTVTATLVNPCRPWLGAVADYYPGVGSWKNQILAHEQRIGRTVDVIHGYHPAGKVTLLSDERFFVERGSILYLNWRPANVWRDANGSKATVNAQIDKMAAQLASVAPRKIMLSLLRRARALRHPGHLDLPRAQGHVRLTGGLQGDVGLRPGPLRGPRRHEHRVGDELPRLRRLGLPVPRAVAGQRPRRLDHVGSLRGAQGAVERGGRVLLPGHGGEVRRRRTTSSRSPGGWPSSATGTAPTRPRRTASTTTPGRS